MAWYQEWFGEEYLELYSHRDENEAREQVAFFRRQCGDIGGALPPPPPGKGRAIPEVPGLGYSAPRRGPPSSLLPDRRPGERPEAKAAARLRPRPPFLSSR